MSTTAMYFLWMRPVTNPISSIPGMSNCYGNALDGCLKSSFLGSASFMKPKDPGLNTGNRKSHRCPTSGGGKTASKKQLREERP